MIYPESPSLLSRNKELEKVGRETRATRFKNEMQRSIQRREEPELPPEVVCPQKKTKNRSVKPAI